MRSKLATKALNRIVSPSPATRRAAYENKVLTVLVPLWLIFIGGFVWTVVTGPIEVHLYQATNVGITHDNPKSFVEGYILGTIHNNFYNDHRGTGVMVFDKILDVTMALERMAELLQPKKKTTTVVDESDDD